MTGDRLALIEEKLIEIAAHIEVDNLLLQAIIGQIAAESWDWRHSLDMMRSTTEAAFRDRDCDISGDRNRQDATRHQRFGEQRIEATFQAIYQALLAIEKDGQEKRSRHREMPRRSPMPSHRDQVTILKLTEVQQHI